MEIVRADLSHLSKVAALFDLYRQFYQCPPDLALAAEFIHQRLKNRESVIFLAQDAQGNGLGFTQLYPSFCSVEAIKIYILYDLYVDSEARKLGIGKALMDTASEYAQQNGGGRIDLLTAKNNLVGQSLYEGLGYCRVNEDFYAYSLNLQKILEA
ncbi:GNAT family N-acetyltransferase [Oceanospirillum beijerinckii]|uniref:GNAT family N-acetyltransferase n=1 Tax=Oceanospirillum beijerinckii TaxID=64976 RepID=UPI00040A15BF|nr:N-acetyltransferase [Oceanospirillum beijerinckii]